MLRRLLWINGVRCPRAGAHHKSRYDQSTPAPPRRVRDRTIFTTTRLGQSSGQTHDKLRRRADGYCDCVARVFTSASREGRSGSRGARRRRAGGVAKRDETVQGGHQQKPERKEVVVLPWPRVARLSLLDDWEITAASRQPVRQGRDTEIIQRHTRGTPAEGPARRTRGGEAAVTERSASALERKQDQVGAMIAARTRPH